MYKVGDEVLVKGEVVEVMQAVPYPYRVKIGEENHLLAECEAVYLTKTYEQGLSDAWQLAKKIVLKAEKGGFNYDDFVRIFGIGDYTTLFEKMTVEEALAKIEAYEKEKKIKVGDEVVHSEGSFQTKFTVTFFERNKIEGFDKNGNTHSFCYPNPYIKKTGKHIDIEGLLKQIGE